ncbi:hypothetical protein TorRG33x02_348060 [Trema orientale]|uniref:Uncharacterized protein n=1 Tax=Trema orientale TaxID=63057 RepID=A0A2P5AKS9_TREOI|nr:hypothetical protein TorRG33x02_348060 [Trema orientale]
MEKIDLSEAKSLFKATPLYAHAKPRLNPCGLATTLLFWKLKVVDSNLDSPFGSLKCEGTYLSAQCPAPRPRVSFSLVVRMRLEHS